MIYFCTNKTIILMKIIFNVNFRTLPGQDLLIIGSIPELGGDNAASAAPMEYVEDGNWRKEINVSSRQERIVKYRYFVRNSDGSCMYEVGQPRVLELNMTTKKLILQDEWQGNTPIAPFLSTPFAGVFFQHACKGATPTHVFSRELIIRATVPNVEKGAVVLICGSTEELGCWDPSKAPEMMPVYGAKWEKHFNSPEVGKTVEFKFVKRSATGEARWEEGDNRTIEIPDIALNETRSVEYSMVILGTPEPRFAGTAVPIFSLRSENDWGIGDFSDLKQLVDWASATRQSIVQILPVNDTCSSMTWTDSYPYGGISIMALHPVYLNPSLMGELKADKKTKVALEGMEAERKRLNELPQIDYEAVLALKTKYFRAIFEQNGIASMAEPEFLNFFKNNSSWLLPYAAFCTLRDRFGTADFAKWGKSSKYSARAVEKMYEEKKAGHEMKYYVFLQYHLHKQLTDSCAYAHAHGVAIKGDVPIGITRHSVEAWVEPYYFNMNSQAGAPPDDFAVKGQNWGFPTYNWDKMSEDGYSWWKKRFAKMAEYCDAYRIDHVLGFFRIWEIPSSEVTGLMGHFSPAMPYSYEDLLGHGFDFHFERDAKPYIRYYQVHEMFGEDSPFIQKTFLNTNELDIYTMKPEFATQKAVSAWFDSHSSDFAGFHCVHTAADLCSGVMALISEVLFLEDPKQTGKFHPRISAQFTYAYKALPYDQQCAFNRLYDDFYYRRHNQFWQDKAMQKLPELISATNMLTCAEDLGMVPACVPYVLGTLRILSLEVQRMPKDPHIHIGNPAWYPYLSVCTTGSHDTSSLRGWLEETNGGSAPTPAQCENIVREHVHSPSMLTILPLQDWMSIDASSTFGDPKSERINIPAEVPHYWRFRMPVTLAELSANARLNTKISALISDSGRA